MTAVPDGLELDPVDDSPFLDEKDMVACPNCGNESNHPMRSGPRKGFCPICRETA